jgi:hypothetical protein
MRVLWLSCIGHNRVGGFNRPANITTRGEIRMRTLLAAATAATVAAFVLASTASAARTQDQITCGGTTYTLTVTSVESDNAPAWGVGTISGGSHVIPTSFTFSAYDLTKQTVLFSDTQAKGNGNGQHNQATMTCTGDVETISGADYLTFAGPDPRVNADDVIEISFSVTVIQKP